VYPEALPFLRCPRHPHAPLALAPGARLGADGAILAGALRCPGCATSYPIVAGVPDLLGPRARPGSPAQLANDIPLTAWGYERLWRGRALSLLAGEPLGYGHELPLICGLAAPEWGGLIVDVACSTGLYTRALERARGGAPGHVIGVDHALPMLRQARAYALTQGLRVSFVRAKAQALPFAPGAAAALAMGGSLNEIGDRAQALRELRRVLAPDGRIALMCLTRAGTARGRTLQALLGLGGVAFPPLDRLNRELAAAGLRLRAQWRRRVVLFSLLQAE
jgi:SAM-dependent methyltransferase